MANKIDKYDAFFKSFSETDELLNFKMANETIGEKRPVVSTGSYLLDDVLSSGGLPKGRLIQYYGPPGSGKTLMSMLAMVEAQKLDPEAKQVFIDAEQHFDVNWAETLGLDTSRVILVDGDTASFGRSCFEFLLGVPKEDKSHAYAGKKKEGLLDKIASNEFNINMIVLDSLGMVQPPGEDVSEIGKNNIGLMARFLTITFRKLSLEVNRAKVPFILINHKKDSMDPYGKDHKFAGGNSYEHSLSANVYFEAVLRKDAAILDENENKIGHMIRATIEKSKFGPYPKKCEFKVNFGIGVVSKHEEIAQLAVDYGVVSKPSTVTHEYKDKKWVGYNKYVEALGNDFELCDELLLKINEARDAKFELKRKEQLEKRNKLQQIESKNV